jgi:hypothetical protein
MKRQLISFFLFFKISIVLLILLSTSNLYASSFTQISLIGSNNTYYANNSDYGQKKALKKAKAYLAYSAFSYSGLIKQLEYEGFTNSQATYGAAHCGANWNEQAVKKAKTYLNYSSFSHSGLIEQLEYEGFTTAQATYGVNHCSSNEKEQGNEQAVKKAKSYIDYSAFSYSGLIKQLEYEGFTSSQATYGASHCGANWNEQAVEKAKSYIDYSSFSHSSLIKQLEYEGFTSAQAIYGASENGY